MEERIWQSILDLKKWIVAREKPFDLIFLIDQGRSWTWTAELPTKSSPLLVVNLGANSPDHFPESAILQRKNLFSFDISSMGNWQTASLQFFANYLAYVFLPWEAQRLGRTVAVSHFAQSLDGRIATESGDSRWIGSDANLIHAHRMRALCEGILIGSGTLKMDQPALTVRHVPGENPQRIVLGSSRNGDFGSLKKSCPDVVWAIGDAQSREEVGVKYISLTSASSGNLACETLLQELYKRGIHSVYIEGGAQTTSCFLEEGMIDILQLHISPQLLGSGISGIQLPEIQKITDSTRFAEFQFLPVGNSIMFVGEPQKPATN